jgi:hypothetical protein
MHHDALGDVREAQMHFDFPSPNWISGWTRKEYHPGEGMSFGLGKDSRETVLAMSDMQQRDAYD